MAENNPYLGPASFGEHDRNRFFGRDEEARQLSYLLIARRAVLLYAQSGAGKTSLLQAKVIPDLREAGEMRVLPITRVSGPAQGQNLFVANALVGLGLAGATLSEALAPIFAGVADEEEEIPILLVFDQFEEVFTFHRELADQRRAFCEQLRDALDAHPKVGVLLSMREDYLADMDSFAGYLPDRLRTRMRMERLSDTQAEEAIARPAAEAGKPFEPGVARGLVDDLRQVRVSRHSTDGSAAGDGCTLGKYVEPVQLQIVCSQLWSKLPSEAATITGELVRDLANVDDALTAFYRDSLNAVLGGSADISERTLRDWFGSKLITPAKTRGMVYQGETDTEGLPNAAVSILAGKYIIRADVRPGGTWYELAHDRLVEPILADNQEWRAHYRNPVADALTKGPDNLMTGSALADALKFAKENPRELKAEERHYLERSDRTARRNRAQFILGAGIVALLMLFLVGLTVSAVRSDKAAVSNAAVARKYSQRALDKTREAEHEKAAAYKSAADAKASAAEARRETFAAQVAKVDAQNYAAKAVRSQQAATAALTSADHAIGQVIVERSRAATDAGNYELATRYALAGMIAVPAMTEVFGAALANNLDSAPEFKPLLGHQGGVMSAAFSPDGTQIVTASLDGTARIWDAQTGDPTGAHALRIGSNPGGEPQSTAAFSHDGTRIFTTSVDGLAIWDTRSGDPIGKPLRPNGLLSRAAAFSPNGRQIVTASRDGTVRIWDAPTGVQVGTLLGHKGFVYSAAFSPDGARIVTASQDGTARIWDARSGDSIGTLLEEDKGQLHSAAFSPDGTRIVTASLDGQVRIWDARSRAYVGKTLVRDVYASSAAFSPDGARIITNGTKTSNWAAQVWDATNGHPLGNPFTHEQLVTSAAFSPDGRRVVTASLDGTARIWDAQSRSALGIPINYAAPFRSAAFSPDGTRVVTASADGTVRIWDARTGDPVGKTLRLGGGVTVAAFSPDGSRIVTAEDNTARIWDARSGVAVGNPLKHEGRVSGAAFNKDGTRIVTASDDKTARIWDARSGDPIGRPLKHDLGLTSAAFSPNGMRILTADDYAARIWDARTGDQVGKALEDRMGGATVAIFSPDGTQIVTGGRGATARIWDARSGDPIGKTLSSGGPVTGAAFSPDGTRLVTQSGGSAIVWDPSTGDQVGRPLEHPVQWQPGTSSVAFSPDGTRIVALSLDGTARIWDIRRLVAPPDISRREACSASRLLPLEGARTFTQAQLDDNQFLKTVWLKGGWSPNTDLCAAVATAPKLRVDLPAVGD
jgi:WD40 repeat protein